jgi:hypothetical protein
MGPTTSNSSSRPVIEIFFRALRDRPLRAFLGDAEMAALLRREQSERLEARGQSSAIELEME